MTEQKTTPVPYHDLPVLESLPLAELHALWELVPTERQRRYKAMYERELRNAGVGGTGADALEQQTILLLLRQYQEMGLVPAGEVWVKTPQTVRKKAISGELLTPAPAQTTRQPPRLAIVGGVVVFLILVVLLWRGRSGKANEVALKGTLTPTPTVTPVRSITPTPLALENQDNAIRAGDGGDKALAYPVNLRVALANSLQPRVFVVQRRAVRTAEWDFDANPDIAAWISGMAVRPVLGIPYSAENALLFQRIAEGTLFTVQMNTGATLRYSYHATTQIARSDTAALRQAQPGLILLLIGQRDDLGSPTGERLLISADYVPEQELARDGVLIYTTALSTPALPTIPPLPERLQVDVVSVMTLASSKLITVQVRLYNARRSTVQVNEETVWIAFGYAPRPAGPRIPAEGLQAFDLLPEQVAEVTFTFAWAGESYAAFDVDVVPNTEGYQFALQLR